MGEFRVHEQVTQMSQGALVIALKRVILTHYRLRPVHGSEHYKQVVHPHGHVQRALSELMSPDPNGIGAQAK